MTDRTIVYTNPVFWMSGTSLFDQQKYLDAVRVFEKLPPNAKSIYNIGICLLHLGDFKAATLAFRTSIEHDKLLSISYFQIAYTYYLLHDFHSAVKNFEATLMFLGSTEELRLHEYGLKCVLLRSEVLFNLALAFRAAGDGEAAGRAIGQARSCTSSPQIEALLGKLESGWTKDLLPFQVNLKAIFRDPTNRLEGRPPRSRAPKKQELPESEEEAHPPMLSPITSPVLVRNRLPPPPRQPPLPPSAVRTGDGKLRTRSEAPINPEPMAEVKPRSGSELGMPGSNTNPFVPKTKEEKKRLSKEEKKVEKEEYRKYKEEKKKQKEAAAQIKRLSNSKKSSKSPLRTSDDRPNSYPFDARNLQMSTQSSPNLQNLIQHTQMAAIKRVASANDTSPRQSPSNSITSSDSQWEISFQEVHLSHEIGRGAFGRVYQGTWRNAPCCVKVANPETNKEAMEEFLKEANSMKKMRSHPNVCQLFGVCTSPTVSIVMELLSDGSLFNMIHNPKVEIDFSTALSMLKDVCSGMTHLHAEGILHLDLATRNLLMKAESSGTNIKFTVKISDFGMSSSLSNTESIYDVSARSKFPIRWCAPEIASHRQVSKASDVWSFGVVAWEILERKFPYAEMSNQEVIEAVFNQGYRLHKPTRISYPSELYALMLTCWQMDPNRRPSFARIYEDLLVIEKKYDALKKVLNSDGPKFDFANPHSNYGPIWSRVPRGNSALSDSGESYASSVSAATQRSNYSAIHNFTPMPTTANAGQHMPPVKPTIDPVQNVPLPVPTLTANDVPPRPNFPPPPLPQQAAAPSVTSPPAVRRFCSGCGKGIKPVDCFCSYCGTKLN